MQQKGITCARESRQSASLTQPQGRMHVCGGERSCISVLKTASSLVVDQEDETVNATRVISDVSFSALVSTLDFLIRVHRYALRRHHVGLAARTQATNDHICGQLQAVL